MSNTSPKAMNIYMSTQGAIVSLVVALRFYARFKKRAKLGLDDHFIVLTLLFFWAFIGVALYRANNGLLNTSRLTIEQMGTSIKCEIVMGVLAAFAMSFSRFSVIALYHRLFSVTEKLNFWLKFIIVCSVGHLLANALMAPLSCRPVASLWNLRIRRETCLNVHHFFLGTELVNMFLDIMLVCLPIKIVRKLNLPLRERVAVSAIFLLGGFVAVTSILRIAFTYRPKETLYRIRESQFWLSLHLSAGIICACLPTMKVFLHHTLWPDHIFKSMLSNLKSFSKRSFQSTRSNSQSSNPDKNTTAFSPRADSHVAVHPWDAPGPYYNLDTGTTPSREGLPLAIFGSVPRYTTRDSRRNSAKPVAHYVEHETSPV